MNGKLQYKPSPCVLLPVLEDQGSSKSQLVLWLQLCCHPARIVISPVAPTLERRLAWGPVAPKLPPNSLCSSWNLSGLLLCRPWRPGWVPAPGFPGLQIGWEVTYPKSSSLLDRFSPGSDANKQMQSCIDLEGHTRSELGEALVIPRAVCALQITQASTVASVCVDSAVWQIQPPPAM